MVGLRFNNVFEDIPMNLNWKVNPYAYKLSKEAKDKDLPVFFGSSLKGKKGLWLDSFQKRNKLQSKPEKLFLEVGCHKGLCLGLMAQENPKSAFLGVDFTLKRCFLTAKRLFDLGLNNAFSVLADARFVDQFINNNELDGAIIFFPDPWLKRSQRHHRLVNSSFSKMLFSLLKPNGFIWIKTDQASYFEIIAEHLKEAGLHRLDLSLELKDKFFQEKYISHFENLYRGKNLNIYQGVWQKIPSNMM